MVGLIMEHCLINGERCSKCCEVLIITESKNFRDWRAYALRYGYEDTDIKKCNQIYHMVRKISKRRAKKINPYLVSITGSNQAYFTCKNYTGEGCDIYEERPGMCSGYPYYGKTESEFLENRMEDKGLYADECTFYIELK